MAVWTGNTAGNTSVIDDTCVILTANMTKAAFTFNREFGVYDKAPMESRARYLAFVVGTAAKLGWSWAYWQFDSDFVVYDVEKDAWVEPIRKALVP